MPKKKETRFQLVTDERHDMMSSTRVIRDSETGVLYLYHAWGYGGGLTPLLDRDGKPLTDRPVIEKQDKSN